MPKHSRNDALRNLLRDLTGADSLQLPSGPRGQEQGLEIGLRNLEQLLEQQQRENERLRNRLAYMQSGLGVLDEEHAIQMRRRRSHSAHVHGGGAMQPMHMMQHPSWPMPMPPDSLAAASSRGDAAVVSVWALPDASGWTPLWDERLRCMCVRDMVLLYRQYTQATAMMLPRAETFGSASPEYGQLLSLMDRFVVFSQHALSLAPRIYEQRTRYDLETMEPTQAPSKAFYRDLLSRQRTKARVMDYLNEYAITAARLRLEYQALSKQHKQLVDESSTGAPPDTAGGAAAAGAGAARAGAGQTDEMRSQFGGHTLQADSHAGGKAKQMGGQGGSHAGTSSHSEGSSSRGHEARALQLEEVLAHMQANLFRQGMALKQVMFALWFGLRENFCTDIARFYLVTYPMPLEIVDFIDAVVDSATEAQRAQEHGGGGGGGGVIASSSA